MKVLLTSDLHLTDKKEDQYRFEFLDHLIARVNPPSGPAPIDTVAILGDITDMKDRHSAELVNKVVDYLHRLSERAKVVVLMGNHDYSDYKTPFFRFLTTQNMDYPRLTFVTKPYSFEESATEDYHTFGMFEGNKWWYGAIPHHPEAAKILSSEEALKEFTADSRRDSDRAAYTALLLHHTFKSSKASNGREMEGSSVKPLECLSDDVLVFSGDIHVPQQVGRVTYVGSPYHVRFGDNYTPRYIELDLDTGKWDSIEYTQAPKKIHAIIDDPMKLHSFDASPGDQIKVTCHLSSEKMLEWREQRSNIEKICQELDLQVDSISLVEPSEASIKETASQIQRQDPKDIVAKFAKNNNLTPAIRDEGLRIAGE